MADFRLKSGLAAATILKCRAHLFVAGIAQIVKVNAASAVATNRVDSPSPQVNSIKRPPVPHG